MVWWWSLEWPQWLSTVGESEDMKSLTDLAADLDVSTEQVLIIALPVVATRAGVEDLADWEERNNPLIKVVIIT